MAVLQYWTAFAGGRGLAAEIGRIATFRAGGIRTSIPLGTRALKELVAALRCGLDRSAWSAEEQGRGLERVEREAGETSLQKCRRLLNTAASEEQLPPFDAAAAHALYRHLFGRIEDLIKNKSLLIVPAGPLTQLPFEALVTEKPVRPSGEHYQGFIRHARESAQSKPAGLQRTPRRTPLPPSRKRLLLRYPGKRTGRHPNGIDRRCSPSPSGSGSTASCASHAGPACLIGMDPSSLSLEFL